MPNDFAPGHDASPPEEFVEQVKQALEHLYDYPHLQRHPLTQQLQLHAITNSAQTVAQQLRRELVSAIDTLNPGTNVPFSDPRARLYNLLLLHYVEGMTIQETADELGISVRQTYRNLRHGNESVATVLWARRPISSQELRAIQLSSVEAEMRRLDTDPKPTEINLLLERAQHAVDRLALQRGSTIKVKVPAEPVIVLTDPVVAQQVLVNLLSYAVKQAQPGVLEPELVFSAEKVSLIFRYGLDTGAKITPVADLPVAQIAERLGWKVEQNHHPSKNSHTVTLHMTAHGPTILVVDDNEGLVQLLERYLTDHACRVAIATSGQEGLQLVQSLSPSVIVLDVMMPEMDGWEFLQRLRALPQVGNTPVIICSVFDDPELAYSLGAALFVAKPVSRNDILDALYQLGVVQRGLRRKGHGM